MNAVLSTFVKLLRVASLVICAIVVASFVTFVVEQTKTASGHQQEVVRTGIDTPAAHASKHEGSVHKALDEASDELTSPFAGIVSSSSSEWATRGVKLLLALVVYGFGLGYVARVLRVRV
jgi:uncharacterized membrane protein YraQ (UPF0718 family)